MGRFTDVEGQTVWASRPPEGFVVVIDTHGNAACVGLEFLADTDTKTLLDVLAGYGIGGESE